MTAPHPAPARDPVALGRRALAAVAVAAAVAAFLGTLVRFDDPDAFHHLAFGREILRSGFPRTEPFLYPFRGQPSGAPPYWLGSVAISAWRAAFGEAGLSFLPAAVGAALAALLLLDAKPRGRSHGLLTLAAAAAPIALALETYRYRAAPRTEIFSALFLAYAMASLRAFEDGRRRPLLALPLVAVLWTNVHPATAVALVPLGILVSCGAAQRVFERATGRRVNGTLTWRDLAIAAGVLALTFAASGIHASRANPVAFAVRFALAALRLDGGGIAAGDTALANVLGTVGEMRGGGWELFATPVGVLIAVALGSFLLRPGAIRPRELVTVAAFAILPFAAVRFAMFFAIVAAPIAARNLGEAVGAIPVRLGRVRARSAASAVLAAAAVATAPLGALAPHIRFGTGLVHGAFPLRGVDYLESIGFDGRLFNTFHLGGYLEWRGVGPPFQDGRGATRPEDAEGALRGPLHPAFADLDARYRFDALLVTYPGFDPETNPGAYAGIFDPDRERWALVAFDDAALVYLRRDGKYGERAAGDEFRHVTPANPVLSQPRDFLGALRESRRSVAEAPGCFRCRFFLGELALAAGLATETLEVIAPARAAAFGPEREAFEGLGARAVAAGARGPPR